jgi:hypothetical protein
MISISFLAFPTHFTHLRPELFHRKCGDFKAFRWGRVARDIYRTLVNVSFLPPLLNASGSLFIAAGRKRMLRLVVFPDEGSAVQVNGTIEFPSDEALRRLSLRRLDPTGVGPRRVIRPPLWVSGLVIFANEALYPMHLLFGSALILHFKINLVLGLCDFCLIIFLKKINPFILVFHTIQSEIPAVSTLFRIFPRHPFTMECGGQPAEWLLSFLIDSPEGPAA